MLSQLIVSGVGLVGDLGPARTIGPIGMLCPLTAAVIIPLFADRSPADEGSRAAAESSTAESSPIQERRS